MSTAERHTSHNASTIRGSARNGRPRRYDFAPAHGFAHPDAAYLVAALDELSERLFDLIRDLPQEALDFVPEVLPDALGAQAGVEFL